MTEPDQSILEDGEVTVDGRDDSHGHPVVNHRRIADMWSAYLGIDITAAMVADMMIHVKQSRTLTGGIDRDHRVDIAGYDHIARLCELADQTAAHRPPYYQNAPGGKLAGTDLVADD